MVRIQSEIKRGFLRQICAGAKRTSSTVGEALLAFQAQVYSPSFSRGKILVSTSGSGQSSSFEIGVSGKQFTQENVFAMSEELLCLLAFALADTTAALADDTTATGTDNIFNYIASLDPLNAISEQRGDWSNLNTYATTGSIGAPA